MSWNVTFLCKSCLNYITRWFMKFGTKRTNPVIGTEIQFKFLHWVSTLQATTPQPEPLFIPKQDRRTSFMMPNHPMVWNLYLVQVGFPPFWQSFCWFSSREMEFLTNYWVVSLHFCCNDIYLCKNNIYLEISQIGAVGGEMYQIGTGKWGSRRGN